MLKILYISPENTVGTLSYWKRGHELMGNQCRYVTFFRTAWGYEEDILLNLPLVAEKPWFMKPRQFFAKYIEKRDLYENLKGFPPIWNPPKWEKALFEVRECLWKPKIEQAIREYRLEDYDIYHFECGTDFFRDAHFAKKIKRNGKKIICHYHGREMRNRGVIPEMDKISDLNLTNELDLISLHPDIKYIFLPFDVKAFKPKTFVNNQITICHATTDRLIKGSDKIIEICKKLEKNHGIKFTFLENKPNSVVLEMKGKSDIYIDQITDKAWGYGMNSLESLSMGVPCLTYLNPTYEKFIPDHPFINVNAENLEEKLIELIENPEMIKQKAREGREWVEKYHDYRNVIRTLYEYYKSIGIET
jgi:glycosyltransferase involved in cell wall biosynthesis